MVSKDNHNVWNVLPKHSSLVNAVSAKFSPTHQLNRFNCVFLISEELNAALAVAQTFAQSSKFGTKNGATTLSITTFDITTLSKSIKNATLRMTELSITVLHIEECCTECCKEAYYAECRYAECRYGECRGAPKICFQTWDVTYSIQPLFTLVTLNIMM